MNISILALCKFSRVDEQVLDSMAFKNIYYTWHLGYKKLKEHEYLYLTPGTQET